MADSNVNLRNRNKNGNETSQVRSTFEKGSDHYESSEDNDIEIKFGILDIIRILLGILFLGSILSKLILGSWLPISLYKLSSKSISLEIPGYWKEKYDKFPITFNLDDLKAYRGSTEPERILLSIKGHVFDVTKGSSFYGKWGAYQRFTGTDCTNLFSYSQWDLTAFNDECNPFYKEFTNSQLQRIDGWLEFFRKKYPEIGTVVELIPETIDKKIMNNA
ncbi:hypothetical protein Kpol_520p28 [Vanderwaltozyma polyspora DSM 70294]|uniref:Cytochrome b5 heme-binding domain-containing protein n=1 Tax=Vanderwaltozyma polyspora (strain ATCC 22028 / DSM 70294 / BCRC 21397 / CBS 2163 / NBRC 10782 / NRRL Y-8283 / UCD 57-17) TaxID=436907 RepID=A7TMB2_VANPO|nr:uncharacterized protein Kpol_520p28 [Vanderwaltozyma polyspora DSM 70294]EDO16606.1 hypothetical protein Kpol_520p28 [Vanderwaltozyma polyspora DSM 70294]